MEILKSCKQYCKELRYIKRNSIYRVQFYNFWKQSYDDIFWNRYINGKGWLDGNNLKVAVFSVFGRKSFIERVNADIKIFFSGENLKKETYSIYADHCLCYEDLDLAIGFELFENPRYIRFPLWMIYMFNPVSTVDDIKNKCLKLRYPDVSEKNKFASFVASAEWDGLRKNMVEKISEIECVDCGGKLFHNDDTLLNDFGNDKKKYIKQYLFNICPENDCANGYVTEKLFESIESGCIPIYWGSYNMPEPSVINKDAVVFWDRKNDGESAIRQIKQLHESPKLLSEFLKQPRLANTAEEYILDTFSDLKKRFDDIFSQSVSSAK